MPVIVDYPQASLASAVALAVAVDELGGSCTLEMAAEKMNKKVGGGFKAIVGAAVKFDLLTSKKGRLTATARFKDYKLAYSKEEATIVLRSAFLSAPLFSAIHERFQGRDLPVSHFEKLLIREFGVNESVGSRVAKYFIEGAKQTNLLSPDGKLVNVDAGDASTDEDVEALDDDARALIPEGDRSGRVQATDHPRSDPKQYAVRITGPGMDSQVFIGEVEDLEIVSVMLQKIRRQLVAASGTETQKTPE